MADGAWVGLNIAHPRCCSDREFPGRRDFSAGNLQRIQRRRRWPARFAQRLQIASQDRITARVLSSRSALKTPLFFRALARFSWLRRCLAG